MPWIKKREKTFFYIYAVWLLSVLNSRFPGGSGLTGTRTFPFWVLLEVLDDVGGGDNWSCKSCKAAIKSSPPTNQHLRQVFCGVWGSRCVKNAPKVAVVNYVPRSRWPAFESFCHQFESLVTSATSSDHCFRSDKSRFITLERSPNLREENLRSFCMFQLYQESEQNKLLRSLVAHLARLLSAPVYLSVGLTIWGFYITQKVTDGYVLHFMAVSTSKNRFLFGIILVVLRVLDPAYESPMIWEEHWRRRHWPGGGTCPQISDSGGTRWPKNLQEHP